MKIDAHQHFWALARGDYGWLTPDLSQIYRDFGPDDLAPLLQAQGIDGTILVQAAPTVAETEYLLSLADKTPFIKGVVGWVDFDAPDARALALKVFPFPYGVGQGGVFIGKIDAPPVHTPAAGVAVAGVGKDNVVPKAVYLVALADLLRLGQHQVEVAAAGAEASPGAIRAWIVGRSLRVSAQG